jgi:hypothetical protein
MAESAERNPSRRDGMVPSFALKADERATRFSG